jgi:general secretion pathway protein B
VSLILDALRKADAERERGAVPSLHSHPVGTPSPEPRPAAHARRGWPWIAVSLAVGLTAAATWFVATRERTPETVAAAPVTPPPVAPPAQPSTGAATTAPSSPATPAPYVPPGAAAGAQPAPWPQPEGKARPETKDSAPVTYLGNVPPPNAGVVPREQLPPEIRGALPPITIGGSIYSPTPSGRSLIVNGQLFRERDRLTQDLSLEEIRLKAAVFSFRGYRFEVLF